MEELLNFFKNGLHNEFAKAGIVTVIFSGLLYSLKGYLSSIWFYIEQNIKSTVTFRSDSHQYELFTQYLFTILPKTHYDSNSKIGIGTYYRIIHGKFSIINIFLEKMMDRYIHTINVTSYFSRSLPSFINGKLQELAKNKIEISTNSNYVQPKILPTKSKVLLPTKSGKKLYKIIDKILKSDMSRTGLLLYGDPGSGKSRAIIEVAQKFGLNIRFICINATTNIENIQEAFHRRDDNNDLFDKDVHVIKACAKFNEHFTSKGSIKKPAKYIVLLEDIDRLQIFQQEEKESKYSLTKTDLLNTFDGIFAPENCLIIATANDYNKIEPALIRAGRFDIHLKFNNPTEQEIKDLYKRLMGKDCNGFLEKNKGKSLADVFNSIKLEKLRNIQ